MYVACVIRVDYTIGQTSPGQRENASVNKSESRFASRPRERKGKSTCQRAWQTLQVETSAGRRASIRLNNQCMAVVYEVERKSFCAIRSDFGIVGLQGQQSQARGGIERQTASGHDQVAASRRVGAICIVIILLASERAIGINRHRARQRIRIKVEVHAAEIKGKVA